MGEVLCNTDITPRKYAWNTSRDVTNQEDNLLKMDTVLERNLTKEDT